MVGLCTLRNGILPPGGNETCSISRKIIIRPFFLYTYVYCVFSANDVSRVFYHFENTTPSFLRQVLKLWSTEMSKVKDKRQKF